MTTDPITVNGVVFDVSHVLCLDAMQVKTRVGEVRAQNKDWVLTERGGSDVIVMSHDLFSRVFATEAAALL